MARAQHQARLESGLQKCLGGFLRQYTSGCYIVTIVFLGEDVLCCHGQVHMWPIIEPLYHNLEVIYGNFGVFGEMGVHYF